MLLFVLITYDVNTETPAGRKRLRQVAKACQDYGQRVQNSVFECNADAGQWLKIKDRLVRIIDKDTDSLRFYMLGNDYKNKVEHYGIKPSIDVNGPLII
jgi:CRISPR-associated protein Cas2